MYIAKWKLHFFMYLTGAVFVFALFAFLAYMDTQDVVYTTNPIVEPICSVKRNYFDYNCWLVTLVDSTIGVINPEVVLVNGTSMYMLRERKEFHGKIFGDQSKPGRTILYLPANRSY